MISLLRFHESDIEILKNIMRDAFNMDSKMHLNGAEDGPSGYDNGEYLRKYFLNEEYTSYTIYYQDEVIGAVNLLIDEESNVNILDCLFLEPAFQNKGYGKIVFDLLETYYPNTKLWVAHTPIFSIRNHHFYINKCGFNCVRIINPMDINNGYYVLHKEMEIF